MSRPRKYRHVYADRCRLSDHDNEYIPSKLWNAGFKPFDRTRRDQWRRQAGWSKRARSQLLIKPNTNGRGDPLTVMLVFDCLMRLETDGLIQANNLTSILIDNYPHMRWDPVTVGTVMSGLADVVDDRVPGEAPPIIRDRSGGVTYYILSDTPKAREWMGRARDWLAEAAQKDIVALREGEENPSKPLIFEDLGLVE